MAHALLHISNNNNNVTVDLYDARTASQYNATTSGGAGVQLNGGLVALGRIHPALREAVYRAGLPQIAVESISHTSSNDNDDQGERLLQLDLPRLVREKPSSDACRILLENDKDSNQQKQPPQRLWWISIMRAALQQTLLDQLFLLHPSTSPVSLQSKNTSNNRPRLRVQLDKKLVHLLQETDETNHATYTCHFADGTESDQSYDLIVDASGINSVTRQYIQNPKLLQRGTVADSNRPKAIYSGIRIRYAIVDGKPGDATVPNSAGGVTLRQQFGRAAYALSGVYGAGAGVPPARCAFIVYLDPLSWGPFGTRSTPSTPPLAMDDDNDDENADWSQDNPAPSLERARRDMLDQLQASGIPIHTELGQYIAQADRFFELGSYFHNPFHKWSSSQGRLVLCGDAAHALPPFLGQGANQAIQDAYCLVQQLDAYNTAVHEYNDSWTETATTSIDGRNNELPPPQLQHYLEAYEQTRWPSTFAVFWKSVFLGYLETGGFVGVYAKFRDVFFKFMGWIGVAERVLLSAATPKLGD